MYGFAISLYNTTRWLYVQGAGVFGLRITESGNNRTTENNNKRIIE